MKTAAITLLTMLLFLGMYDLHAQSRIHYNLLNSLNEVNGNAPALTILGNQGNFVIDTLSEIQGNNKIVYRFEKNDGLQFNNIAAGNFLGESYTIELYFVFDELTSWKRVVDWKNRKTDWGAYVYYGQLNFYSILYSGEAPVIEDEYTYYVITRDGTSKKVLIYTDADVEIEFTDYNNDAVMDGDGVLNFFHDDLIVPNEASSGAVAMIKLYDYILDSTTIRHNWNEIGSTVFGTGDPVTKTAVNIYPNPATDYLHITLPESRVSGFVQIDIFNQLGQNVLSAKQPVTDSCILLETRSLESGLYYFRILYEGKMVTRPFLVE